MINTIGNRRNSFASLHLDALQHQGCTGYNSVESIHMCSGGTIAPAGRPMFDDGISSDGAKIVHDEVIPESSLEDRGHAVSGDETCIRVKDLSVQEYEMPRTQVLRRGSRRPSHGRRATWRANRDEAPLSSLNELIEPACPSRKRSAAPTGRDRTKWREFSDWELPRCMVEVSSDEQPCDEQHPGDDADLQNSYLDCLFTSGSGTPELKESGQRRRSSLNEKQEPLTVDSSLEGCSSISKTSLAGSCPSEPLDWEEMHSGPEDERHHRTRGRERFRTSISLEAVAEALAHCYHVKMEAQPRKLFSSRVFI